MGIYRFTQIPVATWESGDVFARAFVRWLEIESSIAFIREQLQTLPGGRITIAVPAIEPNRLAVSYQVPIIDIDYNFRNPITNLRTFGSDPERVRDMGVAYVEAVQAHGVGSGHASGEQRGRNTHTQSTHYRTTSKRRQLIF